MEPVVPNDKNDSFSRLKETRSSPWIIGNSNFRRNFFQIFSWTSLNTLAMELVGLDGQNIPFSRSNDPWSSLPSFLVIRNSDFPLTTKRAYFQGQTSLGVGEPPILSIFVCNSSQSFLFTIFLEIRNFDLALTAKTTYFQSQTSPGAGKAPIFSIFVCYSPWSFGDPEFARYFCQKFSWTFVKTLVMVPLGPDGKNEPFSRSNDPRGSSPSFLVI
ncbi:hypothetical protein H5410_052992 [Solanum commersonii]|uniref:Uncharacterized protein n=1 Tax=Solanum commersonii TaxID=4109 RepID=A0A9J5X4N8_SOLCO|nr:hypothetical protein H5410_052992 [Solanum commersonii]